MKRYVLLNVLFVVALSTAAIAGVDVPFGNVVCSGIFIQGAITSGEAVLSEIKEGMAEAPGDGKYDLVRYFGKKRLNEARLNHFRGLKETLQRHVQTIEMFQLLVDRYISQLQTADPMTVAYGLTYRTDR